MFSGKFDVNNMVKSWTDSLLQNKRLLCLTALASVVNIFLFHCSMDVGHVTSINFVAAMTSPHHLHLWYLNMKIFCG